MKHPRADSSKIAERIIAASITEFASFGFDGANIRNIAQAASVTESTIFYRFGDKKRLFDATLDAAWSGIRDLRAPPDLAAGRDLAESLLKVWETWLAGARLHAPAFRLMLRQTLLEQQEFREQATRNLSSKAVN